VLTPKSLAHPEAREFVVASAQQPLKFVVRTDDLTVVVEERGRFGKAVEQCRDERRRDRVTALALDDLVGRTLGGREVGGGRFRGHRPATPFAERAPRRRRRTCIPGSFDVRSDRRRLTAT
jgi:hypothetical protein